MGGCEGKTAQPSPAITSRSAPRRSAPASPFWRTSYVRFGRLKVDTNMAGSCRRSCSATSRSTAGVAVAVRASTGTPGSAARSADRLR